MVNMTSWLLPGGWSNHRVMLTMKTSPTGHASHTRLTNYPNAPGRTRATEDRPAAAVQAIPKPAPHETAGPRDVQRAE
ncbi:hypothetical protein GCM10023321_35510 [Pseudonocardia eucalypti]|uniref:Uncharacterized protein n=1 Tax=Pseudonocardia eucalypti TaxID=648755 RepID=A0ABP9Q616_9PSEU